MSAPSDIPANAVHLPMMCSQHMTILVREVLKFSPSDPWRTGTVIANMLLFQALTADPRLHARCEGETGQTMSLVLAELGPLCCAVRGSVLERVFAVMAKGLEHASKVSRREVIDPTFDFTTLTSTMRKGA